MGMRQLRSMVAQEGKAAVICTARLTAGGRTIYAECSRWTNEQYKRVGRRNFHGAL